MDPREMFNEIYGIGPDDGHGDGDDDEGYTMAFGTEMLEEEAEESTPAQRRERVRGSVAPYLQNLLVAMRRTRMPVMHLYLVRVASHEDGIRVIIAKKKVVRSGHV